MTQHYVLYKGFIAGNLLESYIVGAKRIISRFYDEHHLREHSAYFSDTKPGRNSYAFNVWSSPKPCFLPAISSKTIAECSRDVAALNQKILKYLKIDDDYTRLLFNVQIYYQSNSPLRKHFDGELQAFTVNADGELNIIDAIRPKYVAVLTLVNHTKGGGTRIFYKDGTSEVVRAEAGDLLVFDNIECEHGADSFTAENVSRDDGLVRMTIGWRSLDRDCIQWKNGKLFRGLSVHEANAIHKQWLLQEWPKMYAAYKSSEQKVAF